MKVGILTFHRAHNYGAVLQCYALQEVIKGMGHDVEVIDYRQPWIEDYYRPLSWNYIRRRVHTIKGFLRYIKGYPKRKRTMSLKRNNFEKFCNTYLQIGKYPCFSTNVGYYDAYVIGSDQLWSENCLGDSFDEVYMGKFPHSAESRVIGYAISINRSSLDDLCNYRIEDLKNFDFLSMREGFAVSKLTEKSHREISQTIDPTLLLEKEKWNPLIKTKYATRKYVVLYQVRAPQGRQVLYDKAKLIANVNGWDVIDLTMVTYGVDDFVSIIRYAQCVITSSFHATVFSVIFGVPFYSYLLKDGKDGRYEDLLKNVGLTDHLLDLDESPTKPLNVNTKISDAAIADLRQTSLHYLTQI